MRDPRWVTGAGLAAVAAVVAHAGPAGVTDGRSVVAAAAGALVAAVGLSLAGSRVLAARRTAALVAAGGGGDAPAYDRAPFAAVVATMLVLQGAAHIGLLAAGVHGGSGAAAAPALHIVLAIVAAWVVVSADHAIASAYAALQGVIARDPRAALRDFPGGDAAAPTGPGSPAGRPPVLGPRAAASVLTVPARPSAIRGWGARPTRNRAR